MVTVEKIIAELKIGGYLDAAEYIERQPCDFDMSTGMCRHRRRPEGATHDVP